MSTSDTGGGLSGSRDSFSILVNIIHARASHIQYMPACTSNPWFHLSVYSSRMQLDETTMSEALLYDAHEVFMRNLSESYAGSAALCTLDSKK